VGGACFATGRLERSADNQTKANATADLVAMCLGAISEAASSLPSLAVHGCAVAVGRIMAACDFTFVAAKRTKNRVYPETRRGLVAGLVMTFCGRHIARTRYTRVVVGGAELIEQNALSRGFC